MGLRKTDVEYLEYLCNEIMKPAYWSHGVLNSEGRTLLNLIARIIASNHLGFRGVVAKVRRNPTYENVSKLVGILKELISAYV